MRLWHLPELFAIYIYNFNIHTYIYIYIHYLAFRDLSPPSRGHSKSLHWGACWTKANSCHILAHDVDMCAWSHMCAWSCCSDTLTMYQLVKQRRASPCRGLAFHEVVLLCSLSFSPVQKHNYSVVLWNCQTLCTASTLQASGQVAWCLSQCAGQNGSL